LNEKGKANGNTHVGVIAEWESGRALPGQLSLPEEDYSVQFVLTEESFFIKAASTATGQVFWKAT
jgi:hypothetical protein